jgi:hypothetical protein
MPAVSVKQRRFFGWAEHNPGQAKAEGIYPKSMTTSQMHDFAATEEKGLPAQAPKPRKRKYYGQGVNS